MEKQEEKHEPTDHTIWEFVCMWAKVIMWSLENDEKTPTDKVGGKKD